MKLIHKSTGREFLISSLPVFTQVDKHNMQGYIVLTRDLCVLIFTNSPWAEGAFDDVTNEFNIEL